MSAEYLDKYRTDPAKCKTVEEYLAALDEEYVNVERMFARAERLIKEGVTYAPEFYLQGKAHANKRRR